MEGNIWKYEKRLGPDKLCWSTNKINGPSPRPIAMEFGCIAYSILECMTITKVPDRKPNLQSSHWDADIKHYIGYCFSPLKCTAKTTVSLKSNLQSSHDINCPGYYSLLKCVAKTTSFKVATVGCIPVCKSLLLVNMGQMPLGIRCRRNMFTYFHRPDLELKAKQDGSTCPWESRSDGSD